MSQRYLWWFLCAVMLPATIWAGGSGLNVAILANQNSTNSLQIANYYAEKRQVPPQNILRLNWPGTNADWTLADFNGYLLNPLLGMVRSRQLTNQIDYVVVCMDLPFRIAQGGLLGTSGTNSTTSALFYGFKPDAFLLGQPLSCSLPNASSNSYAGSELPFHGNPPATAPTNSFLAVMITCADLSTAKAIIDQGVASDGSFPANSVVLGNRQDDPFRTIRYVSFDDAIFNTRLRQNYSMVRDNSYDSSGFGSLLGYQNGMYTFTASQNNFIPGAMADSLTSYSGIIFPPSVYWTSILVFLQGGASGSYGTVVEPCAYLEKFPSPQNYFYQARGFSLAECYYQSVTNPYEGVLVGEPLAAPFAWPASAVWTGLPPLPWLSGVTNLALQISAAAPPRPVQQVDLFVDGAWAQTLTNISPAQNNVLYVTLDGHPTNYTVPANASLRSIASNLAVRLNAAAYTNVTKVRAAAHGDRIQLDELGFAKLGAQIPIVVSNYAGGSASLTTFLSASGATLLDTAATGVRYGYVITNTPLAGDFLQLLAVLTNGQVVKVSVTNTTAGTTLSQFAKAFFAAVNAAPGLQGSAGVTIENVNCHEDYVPAYPATDHSCEFNVRALGPGWAAAQVQVAFSGSPTFAFSPSGTNRLDTNLADLEPRAHLYVTAGVTNLPLPFAFDSTAYANGRHELTAVVYEGSHVRTQQRISQMIQVTNGPLSATFTPLRGGANTDVAATIAFSVVANTNNIARIELFGTGGSLGVVSNQPSASFSVAGSLLGLGLHPFYAVVTAADGKQYRTETQWFRLIGPEPPFSLALGGSPASLTWPATAGRSYDVLSVTSLSNAFQPVATFIPSNSAAQWVDTNAAGPQRFYRVRTSN